MTDQKIVPLTMTQEMWQAARAVLPDGHGNIEAIWDAMLAAAPMMEAHEEALRERLAELRKALKAVEFDCHRKCTACHGWMVDPNGETRNAHTKDCIVAAALKESKR